VLAGWTAGFAWAAVCAFAVAALQRGRSLRTPGQPAGVAVQGLAIYLSTEILAARSRAHAREETMANEAQTATATSTWDIDPAHTLAEFSVKHMMIATVRGRFGKVSGQIQMNEADPSLSSVEVEIDAASLDTREDRRDTHLRSADFLEVEAHPTITFRSKRVVPKGDNRYEVTGALTIRGVTREVVLTVTEEGRAKSPWGQEVVGFTADTKIDRLDYGLKWNQALETGGVLVGNEVKIHIEVEAIKQV
jgi:polyisoprenoid-binding protein YceI